MDRFSFLGSAHIEFIDDLYRQYVAQPDAVEPSWRAFFQGYDFSRSDYGDLLDEVYAEVNRPVASAAGSAAGSSAAAAILPDTVRTEFKVLNLINGYRTRGHLFTATNPVRARRTYQPTLALENFGLAQQDLNTVFAAATEVGLPGPAPLREIIVHLDAIYCRSIGVEYMYIRQPEVLDWIKEFIHQNDNSPALSLVEKRQILHKLNQAVSFEGFLNTKFVGQKRFSIEGGEALIPGLDFLLQRAAERGVQEVVLGMAHRGRLNVLTNVFGKPHKQVFSEFEGKEFEADGYDGFDGDVKYHLGHTATQTLFNGLPIKLNLAPNPSHLEAVDPVVEGIARAKGNTDYGMDRSKVLPILIHGDAAVAGQGIVYEVLQMERLDGYATGGTIHLVINNQVGFTTNYLDARSSTYCTDVAKTVLAPVLHVNGDDVEACVHAMRFAVEYRQKYGRDVFIDLLCYRKYGHNEGDEPRFTQPLLYKEISKHPNPREIYSQKLVAQGDVEATLVKEMDTQFRAMLEGDFTEAKTIQKNVITPFMLDEWAPYPPARHGDSFLPVDTILPAADLAAVAGALTQLPDGKKFFNKAARLVEDRRRMFFDADSIDWGLSEMLAYGTLVRDGFNVRISGEDVERGTFSHRHAIIKVEDSEEEVCLVDAVPGKKGRFAIYNSHLSEYAVLGFDYGYALASPETLTIWEAQFGDFANGAQIIVDQFLSAAEDKWRQQNGLVLFLPHGYEGQGAEHSSARLERFLQLCAEENMVVCNPTTPANHYHLLRRQVKRTFRKPLVVMTPKSLLRHPKAVSTRAELSDGTFQPVLGDRSVRAEEVTKVVFCSGKLYYELAEEREKHGHTTTALVRLEQIYPLDRAAIEAEISRYPKATQFIWAQEEPANMGAWTFLLEHFPIRLERISPAASAAPASGSHQAAHKLQHALIHSVFAH